MTVSNIKYRVEIDKALSYREEISIEETFLSCKFS